MPRWNEKTKWFIVMKRRFRKQLSLPALKRLREASERGDLAGGLIESAEQFGAGRACMRIVLKNKPWILTIEVRKV